MARRDRRRATTGALAVSALFHLALFIVLAYQAAPSLRVPAPAEADFQIQLVTLPPAAATARAPQASPRPSYRTPLVASRPVLRRRTAPPPRMAARAIQPARTAPPHAPPAQVTPSAPAAVNTPAAGAKAGQAGAGAAQGGGGRWSVQGGEGDDDGVRRFLRATTGCSHEEFAQLRPDERAFCDQRVGRDARLFRSGGVDTVPSQKRAYYDATQQAYQALHDSRPRYDAQGNRVLAGHMPSIGCKFGGKDDPPNSLKLGPCFAAPPQGVLTEESGIPKP